MNVFELAENKLPRKDLRKAFRQWYQRTFDRKTRNRINYQAELSDPLVLRAIISSLHLAFIRDTKDQDILDLTISPNTSSWEYVPTEETEVSHHSVSPILLNLESLKPFLSIN